MKGWKACPFNIAKRRLLQLTVLFTLMWKYIWERFLILVQSSLVFREWASNKTKLKKFNDRKFDMTHCIKWFEIHDGINTLQNPAASDAKMEGWIKLSWKYRTLDRVYV